jgi:hypothetical protein
MKYKVFFMSLLIIWGQFIFSSSLPVVSGEIDDLSRPEEKILNISLSEYEKLSVAKATLVLDTKPSSDFVMPQDELEHLFLHRCEIWKKNEYEFIRFNILRGIAQNIKLIWYNEEGLVMEIAQSLQEKKEYVYGDDRKFQYELIPDTEDFKNWTEALSSRIIRSFHSSVTGSSFGYGPNAPFPPHGIFLKTKNEKVFIGITRFGFHLGEWKGNNIDQSKLFYSPDLALFLDDYVKKNKLQNFPKIYINMLSGKDVIQSQIEAYQYRKQKAKNKKVINMINDDDE